MSKYTSLHVSICTRMNERRKDVGEYRQKEAAAPRVSYLLLRFKVMQIEKGWIQRKCDGEREKKIRSCLRLIAVKRDEMNALSSCSVSLPVDNETWNRRRGVKVARKSREEDTGTGSASRNGDKASSEYACGPPRMRSPRDSGLRHLQPQDFACSTFCRALSPLSPSFPRYQRARNVSKRDLSASHTTLAY